MISLKKVSDRKQLAFASIPFIFAIQQFTEGFLWVAFRNDAYADWKDVLTHIFIFFAQVVWPFWIPLAFYMMEKDERRKKILGGFSFLGAALSLAFFYCLVMFPVESAVTHKHIFYYARRPGFEVIAAVAYCVVTIITPFISSAKLAWMIGTLNLFSFLISKLFFGDHLVSVWCFMAALVSILVVVMIRDEEKSNEQENIKINA